CTEIHERAQAVRQADRRLSGAAIQARRHAHRPGCRSADGTHGGFQHRHRPPGKNRVLRDGETLRHRCRLSGVQRSTAIARRLWLYPRIPDRTFLPRCPRASDSGRHERNHAFNCCAPDSRRRRYGDHSMSDALLLDSLLLEKRGRTAILTMNNPPANTWTPESLRELQSIVNELNADLDIYALIITSNSEKFFCAGAELTRFNHKDKAQAFDFALAFGEAFATLANFRGVSIAAITGYAMGGGLEVALACDIRICEQ